MELKQLNPAACKTYLLKKGNEVVLIDPVLDHTGEYLSMIEENGWKLSCIVDTHTHADHISGGPALRDATNCDYIMHENSPVECANIRVKEGSEILLAGEPAYIMETPGHTRDSISIRLGNFLFTGDFLFLDDAGAGRDDLPGGNPEDHWYSLQKLKNLSEDLIIYPAHEYRNRVPSSLKMQRSTNPHLRPMTKEEFVVYINDLKLGPADWMKDVLKANYKCATDPKAAWIPTDVPACEIKGTMNPNAGEIPIHTICKDKTIEAMERGAFLLDVREVAELEGNLGKIDGVYNIPVGQLAHRLEELDAQKKKEIVVICRSGARATTAAQILYTAGFENVSVLEGGMLNFRR